MSNLSIWDAGAVFAMGAAPDGGSAWVQFVPFAIVLAIFYFIILLPMKRKQQKVARFLENLKVNDRIVTTGGIYGQITRLGDQTVQVQIADKVRIELAKAAIGGYQGQDPVQEPVAERTSQ
jgi:preprotein translocase subunit YajC